MDYYSKSMTKYEEVQNKNYLHVHWKYIEINQK